MTAHKTHWPFKPGKWSFSKGQTSSFFTSTCIFRVSVNLTVLKKEERHSRGNVSNDQTAQCNFCVKASLDFFFFFFPCARLGQKLCFLHYKAVKAL